MKKVRTKWDIHLVNDYISKNSECTLISKEFVKVKDYLDVKCHCGAIFSNTFDNLRKIIKNGYCIECDECKSNRSKEKSLMDVKNFVEGNTKCKIVSDKYSSFTDPLEFSCSCGAIFERSYKSVRNSIKETGNLRCLECNNRSLWTTNKAEQFLEECGVKLLSDLDEYVAIKCIKCKKIIVRNWKILKGKKGFHCKECAHSITMDSVRITKKQFMERVQSYNEYIVKSDFISLESDIDIEHPCGHIRTHKAGYVYRGISKCKICSEEKRAKNHMLTIEYCTNWVESNTDLKLLSTEYKGKSSNLDFECSCGEVFSRTLEVLEGGSIKCKRCTKKQSYNETVIEDFLRLAGLSYKKEVSFDGLKGLKGGALRYDFAIYNKTGQIACLIEYDGELHFISTEYHGGDERLEANIAHDKIKDDFAVNNNIPLLRIPYWESDSINHILLDWLIEICLMV